mgnify:CR=1 FL=1
MIRRSLRCSFCRRPEDEAAKLVAGPRAYIWDRCVAIAADMSDSPGASQLAPRNFTVTATGADQPLVTLPGVAQLLDGAPRADLQTLAAALALPQADWHDDGRGSAEYRNAMLLFLVRRAADDLLGEGPASEQEA